MKKINKIIPELKLSKNIGISAINTKELERQKVEAIQFLAINFGKFFLTKRSLIKNINTKTLNTKRMSLLSSKNELLIKVYSK